jgi:tetratricopeptide (TPR) repeat protein
VASSIPTDQAIAIALAHHRAGRIAEAEGIYRQLISREPKNARVLDLLGVLLLQTGQLDLSAAFLRRAIAADPNHANYHCNLGSCLRRLGKSEQAIAEFRDAIRLNPALAVAHNNLGISLAESLWFDSAITAYQRALDLDPQYAEAWANLANAYKDAGKIDDALAACARSLALKPESAAAHNSLGVTLAEAHRYAEAIAAYRQAISLDPRYGDARSNLANALAAAGQHDQALSESRKAVELEPLSLQSHWNYAVILLRSGDLPGGFREYEWRWKQQSYFPRPSPRYYPPRFPTPHWTGGDITGRTILLHAEQGFGDTLHFCRYAPLVAARGARVIMEVQTELHRLFTSLTGVAEIFSRGQALPSFDEHCPLMSLPLAFNTTLGTIPGTVPYLGPAEADVQKWATILTADDGHSTGSDRGLSTSAGQGLSTRSDQAVSTSSDQLRRRIGLCWAGSADHADDCDRSLALSQFSALADDRFVFYSLQKGPPAAQALAPPAAMNLIDLTARVHDFADTAALMMNLDLVITADTAVAHLAGALGKPVWVLLRHLSDWRWLIARPDTPWYPTMRLFRQTARGDWTEPLQEIASLLRSHA